MNHSCWCTFDAWSKQARLQLPFWARTRPFSRLWIKIRYLIQRNYVFRGKVDLAKQIAWCWHSVWSPASLTSSTACERRLRACWCRTLSITSEPRCSTVTFWCWSSSLSTKSSSRKGKPKKYRNNFRYCAQKPFAVRQGDEKIKLYFCMKRCGWGHAVSCIIWELEKEKFYIYTK